MSDGDQAQFPGWPITVKMSDNDGRKIKGWLPKLTFAKPNPVVQVIEDVKGEVLYTVRIQGRNFQPKVYSAGKYTVKVGQNGPKQILFKNLESKKNRETTGTRKVSL